MLVEFETEHGHVCINPEFVSMVMPKNANEKLTYIQLSSEDDYIVVLGWYKDVITKLGLLTAKF